MGIPLQHSKQLRYGQADSSGEDFYSNGSLIRAIGGASEIRGMQHSHHQLLVWPKLPAQLHSTQYHQAAAHEHAIWQVRLAC